MTHANLCQLWATQEERIAEWRNALLKQCTLLRDAFIAHVKTPAEPWVTPNSSEEHPYVELLYLHPERKRLKGHIPNEAVTDKGELMFGLAITLDKGPGSFPKESPYFQLAVRFNSGKAEFAFFKTEAEGAETPPGWVAEIPEFVEMTVERLRDYLEFDPFERPDVRTRMGFL